MTGTAPPPETPQGDLTGVRDLLAGFPDPGPMPGDVVARIEAALAREALTGQEEPAPDARVTSLDEHRARRATPRYLGAAAAAAALIVGGLALPGPRGALASWFGGSSSSTSADSNAAGAASGPEQVTNQTLTGQAPGTDTTSVQDVTITYTNQAYTAAGLANQLRGLPVPVATAGKALAYPSAAAESPLVGPIATPIGLRACASALGIPADSPLTADLGTVDGQPAVVIVASVQGHTIGYAALRSCSTGAPGRLAGPIALS